MTTLKYIVSPEFGCCTTGELMQAGRVDSSLLPTLKKYAEEEMKNKGIAITVSEVAK